MPRSSGNRKSRALRNYNREKRYWKRKRQERIGDNVVALGSQNVDPNTGKRNVYHFALDSASEDFPMPTDDVLERYVDSDESMSEQGHDTVEVPSTSSDSEESDDETNKTNARKKTKDSPPVPDTSSEVVASAAAPSTSKENGVQCVSSALPYGKLHFKTFPKDAPTKDLGVRIAPNPKNDKGEMDVQVPVQINFPIPQVGQSDDGVESITFGLGQENDSDSDSNSELGGVGSVRSSNPAMSGSESEDQADFFDLDIDNVEDSATQGDYAHAASFEFFDNPEINAMVMDYIRRHTRKKFSKAQAEEMWDFQRRWSKFDPSDLQSHATLQRKKLRELPSPKNTWRVKDLETGKVITGTGTVFPDKTYADRERYEIQTVWTRLELRDAIRLHAGLHPETCPYLVDGVIDYSLVHCTATIDGIPYGNSSSDNLHVMAVRFKGCRQVYLLEVRIAKRTAGKDVHEFMDGLVNSCRDLGVTLDYFVADAPMRAFVKILKAHSGRYSCEICEASGVCINRKICYPACQILQRTRTHDLWLQCVEDLEQQADGGFSGHVRGIMGRSPLLSLPKFDIVKDAPVDPMHRDWLGLTKSTLWRNTIGIGKTGAISARGQRITALVSDAYKQIRLPREFSRKPRAVDYPNFKAQEWKSLLITSFQTICQVVTEEVSHEVGHIWITFTFLMFVYYGPEWLLQEMDQQFLTDLHETLYDEFAEQFGPSACSYNWHSFYHMPLVRRFGRPSEISTEPFESCYGQVKKSYQPGTRNVGLQIVRNMMLGALGHEECYCNNRLVIEQEKRGNKFNNSIVMDGLLNYYKVIRVERGKVTVRKIKTKPWECVFDPALPLDKVGVRIYEGLHAEEQQFPKSYFRGKGVQTKEKVLIPLYWDMLFS